MMNWIRHLDRLLRGQATDLPTLAAGKFDIPVVGLSVVITLLGIIYGACMGVFALTPSGSGHAMQIPATMVKTPALFLLTLFVTFPSLYVFNALVGSRLAFLPMVRLMIGALAVTLAVLSSVGPIVAFFSVTSASYAFIVLLNVLVFAISGLLGTGFLFRTLHRMSVVSNISMSPPPLPSVENTDSNSVAMNSPLDKVDYPVSRGVKIIFKIWMLVFGLVGMQMAWTLRPFIGSPGKDFTWFRPAGGNFFEAVMHSIWVLMGGK